MVKKKRKGRSSKDFCILWRSLYVDKYKQPFHIKWMLDGNVFKRLMSTYSNVVLLRLIKFSFKEDGSITNFLKSTGYSISVFERVVNQYRQHIEEGGITEAELDLQVPYWDDDRISFLFSCINKNDLNSLLQISYCTESKKMWKILIQKIKKQNASLSYKVKVYYKRWKTLTSTKRRRIKHVNTRN